MRGPRRRGASGLRRQTAFGYQPKKAGRALPSPLLCFSLRARLANSNALADEGEVVVTTGGVRDRGAAVCGDAQLGRVGDSAAVYAQRAAPSVAHADRVAGIAAAVYVADGDRAAIGGSGGNATVTSRGGICELHDVMPSLVPTLGHSTRP